MLKTGFQSVRKRQACVPVTVRERLVREVYEGIDDAVGRELARLRREEGITASCQRGCCSCCGQYIQTNPAEAHALGQYIQRSFSAQQISDLRRGTQQWHAWHAARRHGAPLTAPADISQVSEYEPFCPLLVDRACSAYPVRPAICRTHFVGSDPSACRPSHDHRPVEDAPVVLTSVLHATQPLSQRFKAESEAAGLDFSRSIMLLPHWLALEMGWDFAMEP